MNNQHLPKKFRHAVDILKREAHTKHNKIISSEEIAKRLDITLDQYNIYYDSEVPVEGLSEQLYNRFIEIFPDGGNYHTIEFEIDIPEDDE